MSVVVRGLAPKRDERADDRRDESPEDSIADLSAVLEPIDAASKRLRRSDVAKEQHHIFVAYLSLTGPAADVRVCRRRLQSRVPE